MRRGLPECHEGKPAIDGDVAADDSAIRRDQEQFRRCQRLSKVSLFKGCD
jgi:hypothetical protein